ncbi:MAG: VCBS repeat-containing protein [Deltaproteobacteria bacterium]|nr:VCBS repeat-containing protein [Deltaproteobacteria bacterium]
MAVVVGSNIPSMQAQRRLAENSSTLSGIFERLASGQRINRASDDAAGLSIASGLEVGRRVFNQGIRNLNDGISALQIADSTLDSLSNIVTRIRELAQQAANGSLSAVQRNSIDIEAQQLQKEYFRVSRSAAFNGTRLFDGSMAEGLRLQAGFSLDGSIHGSLGGVMGNGSFGSSTGYAAGDTPYSVVFGDVNGDGKLDMVSADYGSIGTPSISVFMGRGDGTFNPRVSFQPGGYPREAVLGDVNGDGVLDIVTADYGTGLATVLIGRGDGTFYLNDVYDTSGFAQAVALGDVNGDGTLDIVTANYNGTGDVFLGSGNGSFSSRMSFVIEDGARSIALGDLTGDGILDMVVSDVYDGEVGVLIGRGDGTFGPRTQYSTGGSPLSVRLADLNGDGKLDMYTSSTTDSTVSVHIGRGDGTFLARTSYSVGGAAFAVTVGDVNGDGAADLVATVGNSVSVLLGSGNGTFGAASNFAIGALGRSASLGDLNQDGVLDVGVVTTANSVRVLMGSTREGVAPLLPFSLTTQADALQAMGPLDAKLDQISKQRGIIGAFQSRINVAALTLQTASEAYLGAESRVRDADTASEAAHLVRLQISQQAAAAVLAQANSQPALSITLLQI